jgi:hypothetical protein
MQIPELPEVRELKHLSPSLYEAVLVCKARAAWIAFGERDSVPQHSRALLGTSVHAVVEDAHNGRLPGGDDESRRTEARDLFDRKAKDLYDDAHPLLRAKFPGPERIPYYYLFRERAVLLALDAAGRPSATRAAAGAPGPRVEPPQVALVETTLRSRDGLLVGRPDYVDSVAREVVDYKTGAGPDDDPEGLRDSEVRQLRLYVYLAGEIGLDLQKGAVVRADGRRVALDIPEADAVAEGQRAREALYAFNAGAAEGFKQLAEPSPEACRYCPCIPFCEAFWEKATAAWTDRCGAHVEGTVTQVSRAVVQNTALITFELAVARGTTTAGIAVVQQLPENWARAGGASLPTVGDMVRIVDARVADETHGTAVIRPDRLTTALWTVRDASARDGQPDDENSEAGGGR